MTTAKPDCLDHTICLRIDLSINFAGMDAGCHVNVIDLFDG